MGITSIWGVKWPKVHLPCILKVGDDGNLRKHCWSESSLSGLRKEKEKENRLTHTGTVGSWIVTDEWSRIFTFKRRTKIYQAVTGEVVGVCFHPLLPKFGPRFQTCGIWSLKFYLPSWSWMGWRRLVRKCWLPLFMAPFEWYVLNVDTILC